MNGRPFSISECISTWRFLFNFREVWESFLGGFLSHGGTRKSSISRWDFHVGTPKPSSYWGTPMSMETPKWISTGFNEENCWKIVAAYAGYTQHHDMGLSKSHGNCCSFIALMGISWEGPWESTKVVYDCNFSRETSFCGETWIFKNQDHQQMIFH